MDPFNRFSIEDFLAYLFPGAACTPSLFLLLLLTPLQTTLTRLSLDVTTGILLLIWSYVFGLILAGMAVPIIKLTDRIRRFDEPRASLPFSEEVNQEICTAYKAILGVENSTGVKWSTTQFYLCRSLIETWMPNASQLIRRQISLRRVRENMMPVVLIWGCAGLAWGIHTIRNGLVIWGITLLALSLIATPLVLNVLANSWFGNRKREVREICAALLVGFKTGAFDKPNKGTEVSKGATAS